LGFGTFGNVMTVLVLSTMPGGSRSTVTVYFSALAVSDLVLLYTGLLRHWLIYMLNIEVCLGT
jgi:hypothetical protein